MKRFVVVVLACVSLFLFGFQWSWSYDSRVDKTLKAIFEDKKTANQFFDQPKMMKLFLKNKKRLKRETVRKFYKNLYQTLKMENYTLQADLKRKTKGVPNLKSWVIDSLLQTQAYLYEAKDLLKKSKRADKRKEKKLLEYIEGYLVLTYMYQQEISLRLRAKKIDVDNADHSHYLDQVENLFKKSIKEVKKNVSITEEALN